jgi:hypothetical protein
MSAPAPQTERPAQAQLTSAAGIGGKKKKVEAAAGARDETAEQWQQPGAAP